MPIRFKFYPPTHSLFIFVSQDDVGHLGATGGGDDHLRDVRDRDPDVCPVRRLAGDLDTSPLRNDEKEKEMRKRGFLLSIRKGGEDSPDRFSDPSLLRHKDSPLRSSDQGGGFDSQARPQR